MDKPIVAYAHNGILFTHKKEWSIHTYFDSDAKGKKPDTKKPHIVFYVIPF